MRLWLLLSLLVGCEQVAPAGNPLEPVQVAVETPSAEPVTDEASTEEPEEEVFSISSEELLALATGDEAAEEAPEQKSEAEASVSAEETPPPQPAVEQPVAAPPSTSGWSEALGKAWPVRLVTTVPNATPPRAILGLPDGREVVVFACALEVVGQGLGVA